MDRAVREVTKDDLIKYPRNYIVAYAVRNALRVFPLIAWESHFNFWIQEEDNRLEYIQNIWNSIQSAYQFSLKSGTVDDIVASYAKKSEDAANVTGSAVVFLTTIAASYTAYASYAQAAEYAYKVSTSVQSALVEMDNSKNNRSDESLTQEMTLLELQLQDFKYLRREWENTNDHVVSEKFYEQSLWGERTSRFYVWCSYFKVVLQNIDNEFNSNLIKEIYEPYMKMIGETVEEISKKRPTKKSNTSSGFRFPRRRKSTKQVQNKETRSAQKEDSGIESSKEEEFSKPADLSDRKQESPDPIKDSFDRERWAQILAAQLTYEKIEISENEIPSNTTINHYSFGAYGIWAVKDSKFLKFLRDSLMIFGYTKHKQKEIQQERGFSIGLFGNWGTGKTGFISFLTKELEKQDSFFTATYNAWEFQDATNYRAVMAQKVWEGMKRKRAGISKLWLSIRFHLQLGWKKNPFFLLVLIICFLAAITWTIWNWSDVFEEFSLKVFVPLVTAAALYFYAFVNSTISIIDSPNAKKIANLFSKTDYKKQIGEIVVLREELSLLCKLSLKNNERLLVVIDDLDRCHTDSINQILDTVRLLYEVPKVYVLIAVDQRIILQALQDRYDSYDLQKSGIGRDFLAKIIEMPIRLKQPKPNELKSFVNDNLFTNLIEEKEEIEKLDKEQVIEINQNQSTIKEEVAPEISEEKEGPKRETYKFRPALDDMKDLFGTIPVEERSATISANDDDEEIKIWEPTVEERNYFSELTKRYEIDNPRALKRLYNAYGFLYVLLRIGDTTKSVDRLEQSKVLANLLFHLEAKAAGISTRNTEKSIKERFDKVFPKPQTFTEFKETVSCFILPSLQEDHFIQTQDS